MKLTKKDKAMTSKAAKIADKPKMKGKGNKKAC